MELGKFEGFIERGFRLTSAQLNFLADGSYGFISNSGNFFYRNLRVIAQDLKSGYAIVKETCSDVHNYEKLFMLSPDGKQEKMKSE